MDTNQCRATKVSKNSPKNLITLSSIFNGYLLRVSSPFKASGMGIQNKVMTMNPSNNVVLRAENLAKTYIIGKIPVDALRGVNLTVEKGDFLSILGPSGSGKSTLLNMIGALDKPTSGILQINGVNVTALNDNELTNLRRNIGFVFQFFNLIPRFTALENVELPLSISEVNKSERKKRAQELLKMVGLENRLNHKPKELSGGQQQRVAIARALANNPSFLLMDEPTGNVDSKTANEVLDLTRRLNSKGVTIIMVTHDQVLAKESKHTARMLDGVITSVEVN